MGATLKRREGSGLVYSGFEAVFNDILICVFCTVFRHVWAFVPGRQHAVPIEIWRVPLMATIRAQRTRGPASDQPITGRVTSSLKLQG